MSVSFSFTRGKLIIAPVRMCHLTTREPVVALDTGARVTVISPTVATELGFEPKDLEPTVRVTGATGTAPGALLRIGSIAVLGLEVRNVRVLCYKLPPDFQLDGILGLDFLKHFKITIDHQAEMVTMVKWTE